MAYVEVCDICRSEINKETGIYLDVKDTNGMGGLLGLGRDKNIKRKYNIHICDRCVRNIKRYCKENT